MRKRARIAGGIMDAPAPPPKRCEMGVGSGIGLQ